MIIKDYFEELFSIYESVAFYCDKNEDMLYRVRYEDGLFFIDKGIDLFNYEEIKHFRTMEELYNYKIFPEDRTLIDIMETTIFEYWG